MWKGVRRVGAAVLGLVGAYDGLKSRDALSLTYKHVLTITSLKKVLSTDLSTLQNYRMSAWLFQFPHGDRLLSLWARTHVPQTKSRSARVLPLPENVSRFQL